MQHGSVSVITPVYNTAALLEEAIASVAAQSVPVTEMLVVDDGSDDAAAVQSATEGHPWVRLLRQPNRGPSAARNLGLQHASSEFVVFLDSDDQLLPSYVATQLAFLDEHPEVSVVYCDAELFGEGIPPGTTFMDGAPSVGPADFEGILGGRCSVLTTVMARKSAIDAVGGYDAAIGSSEDFDLWLRLVRAGFRIDYQRLVLARHRMRAGSLSADQVWMFEHALRVIDKLAAQPLSDAERQAVTTRKRFFQEELLLEQTKHALRDRDYGQARRAYAEYRRGRPGLRTTALQLALFLAPGLLRRVHVRRSVQVSGSNGV